MALTIVPLDDLRDGEPIVAVSRRSGAEHTGSFRRLEVATDLETNRAAIYVVLRQRRKGPALWVPARSFAFFREV